MDEEVFTFNEIFANAFDFLDPVIKANESNLKALTKDAVAVVTTVTIDVKVIGFFCNVECAISNLNGKC